MIIRFIVLVLCCVSVGLFAQNPESTNSARTTTNDPLITEQRVTDTVLINSYAKRYNPRKALLYAAVLPGLGQVYTKKYWKIPLVYAGMGALIYNVDHNNTIYRDLKSDLFYILNTGELHGLNYPQFTESTVRRNINLFRRNRDFYIVILGLVYVLQMIDAHVDAHLKEFDLNPKLQVRLEPMLDNDPMIGRQAGLSFTIRF